MDRGLADRAYLLPLPMGRFGEPAEFGRVAAYLLSRPMERAV